MYMIKLAFMAEQEKARNSRLRKTMEKFLQPIVKGLIGIPGVTADRVTSAGTIFVSVGSLERVFNEKLSPWVALSLIGLGVLGDALDGQVARALNQSSEEGALFDLLNDRFQESVMSLSRIVTAAKRKDSLGMVLATLAGLTNPLPSLMRAEVEKKGGVVAESGKNPLSFLGTRSGRVMIGVPTTVFPEAFYTGPFAFQALGDLLTTIANVRSFLERRKDLLALSPETDINNDDGLSRLGGKKEKALKKFTIINSLIIASAGAISLIKSLSK